MKTNSSKPMKLTHSTSILAIGLLATALLPVAAAQPDADQILQQMSAKLASAQTFSFKATREIDAALLAGRNAPENARIVVTVQRPEQNCRRLHQQRWRPPFLCGWTESVAG